MGTATPQDTAAMLAVEEAAGEALEARCAELEARLRAAETEATRSVPLPSSSSEVMFPLFSLCLISLQDSDACMTMTSLSDIMEVYLTLFLPCIS